MSQLDILLPFAMPPPELANDLFRELKAPALATLLARASSVTRTAFDSFSGALAHEAWLARQFGLHERAGQGGSPPVAGSVMQAFGLAPEGGTWFVLQPVHIHVARDHLVLTGIRQQAISDAESRALFDAALPLFAEAGKTLRYGDAATWFVRADDWDGLQTSTPDAACGHNIDIWMPKGRGERDWRKLQNEVQMYWHAHPVNASREARGAKPVNSLWLWGGAPGTLESGTPIYKEMFNLSGWMEALAFWAEHKAHEPNATSLLSSAPQRGLLLLDALMEPAMAGDWGEWLQRLRALEADWFAPLLMALKAGKPGRLELILTHQSGWAEFAVTRNSLRKFWISPALSKLLP